MISVHKHSPVYSKNGKTTVYRAISVKDIDRFLLKTRAGKPLGSHWTWDKECATTGLHGGEWQPHDILLTGEVSESDVDWATTFQQNFSHPAEREIFVQGKILLQSIISLETGEILLWEPQILAA